MMVELTNLRNIRRGENCFLRFDIFVLNPCLTVEIYRNFGMPGRLARRARGAGDREGISS
jgi:hypothetical protein